MSKIAKVPSDITTLIAPGKIFMFSKHLCPFCMKAGRKLDQLKLPYEYVEKSDLSEEQIAKLHQISNHKTYPNLYVGTKPIGGCDDLMHLLETGEFKKILEENNVKYDQEALENASKSGGCNIM